MSICGVYSLGYLMCAHDTAHIKTEYSRQIKMTQVHEDPAKQNMILNLWKKVILCH